MAVETATQELFALLNRDYAKLEDANKLRIDEIITTNPDILSSAEFMKEIAVVDMNRFGKEQNAIEFIAKSKQSLQITQTVLSNLQKLKKDNLLAMVDNPSAQILNSNSLPNGETFGTQTIKNIYFLNTLERDKALGLDGASLSEIQEHSKEQSAFLVQIYGKGEGDYAANSNRRNFSGQKASDLLKSINLSSRQPESVQQLSGQEMQKTFTAEQHAQRLAASAPKTLTIEQLRDGAYRGTLTVEQAEQLKKADAQKNVADMKLQDGDAKKSKREPSKDKFKDEDVIKYMYEEWFLGGASALFNKVEDSVLALVDAACDVYVARSARISAEKSKTQDEALAGARAKVASFAKVTALTVAALGSECASKMESFRNIFTDLEKNLGNPNPDWKYYKADDPFIKSLEADPKKAQAFIAAGTKELENRIRLLDATGKLAMLLSSAEMTDEFMRKDKDWRKKDGEYKSDKELDAEFSTRSRGRHQKILEAVSVISEDARLAAEIMYDASPSPTLDLASFTKEHVSKEVNSFIEELSLQAKAVVAAQERDLDGNRFEIRGGINFGPKNAVYKGISGADKFVKERLDKGAVYSEKLFEPEHSKARIDAKIGLFEEAVKENSPNSMENIFSKMKEVNGYNQDVLASRKADVQSRQAYLQQIKSRLTKRDGQSFGRTSKGGRGD